MDSIQSQEAARQSLQARLDAAKTPEERNKLGQFATPEALADDILTYARTLLPPGTPVRFLDPAFGTGSFYSALLRNFARDEIASAQGFEVDPHYGAPTKDLWQSTALDLHVSDFTRAERPKRDEVKPTLIICNPPYVRHHHLSAEDKRRLQAVIKQRTGATISQLAGLYCYFLLLSHVWLAKGGIAGWLVPSEFMEVNYGRALKRYLLEDVTLLRIHRFDPIDVQFSDALVSSAVVWIRNTPPPHGHEVEFTFGGRLTAPHIAQKVPTHTVARTAKWTALPARAPVAKSACGPTLADLFAIKRGLATGSNAYFILTAEQVAAYDLPREFLTPILPSPRYLKSDIVRTEADGEPAISHRLYLLTCNLPEETIRAQYSSLWRYLHLGMEQGVNRTYLCQHRSPWYAQEKRAPAPFLCTYMGRAGERNENPFRFVLNYSRAVAANTYLLLYPRPELASALARNSASTEAVWMALKSITPSTLIGEGRVYGGGLHKVEPRELANVPADGIIAALDQAVPPGQAALPATPEMYWQPSLMASEP